MAYNPNDPRMRIRRSDPLVLSTTWQRIDFNNTTASLNINTFGKDPVSGQPLVMWDTATKLIKFMSSWDMNLIGTLYFRTTVTGITVRSKLQYRIVVPNGGGPGVDQYHPFSEDGGFADVGEITVDLLPQNNRAEITPLYVGSAMRTSGIGIEVRLSTALTIGTATLNSCNFLIQSSGR